MIGRNIIPMQYGLQTGMTAGPRNVVDYSSLNEWIATQRKIKQTPGVSSVQILALRAKQADILITHSGSVDTVASSLMQNGIGLRADAGQGMYTVYSSGGGRGVYR